MLKRKRENNSKNCLVIMVGIFLIIISMVLMGYKLYQTRSIQKTEDILIEEFYEEYNEVSNIPIINVETEIEPNEDTKTNTEDIKYIGLLKIDKIKLEKGLVAKTSPYNNINYNVQILKESGMPDIENGNFILAAHSGSGTKAYFKNLYKLKNEDEIIVIYNGYEYIYKVVNIYDIDKTGTAQIIRNKHKNTLTLITCRENTNKQIIIISELIERR